MAKDKKREENERVTERERSEEKILYGEAKQRLEKEKSDG